MATAGNSERTATERPGFRCIADTEDRNYGKTWCGRRFENFSLVFRDLSTAAIDGRAGGRPVACPDCTKAAIDALTNGQPQGGA